MIAVPFDTRKTTRNLEASRVVGAMAETRLADMIGRKPEPMDDSARLRRNFLIQMAFMVAMWVSAVLLGFSYILPPR